MWPYMLCFTLSSVFTGCASYLKKKNKILFIGVSIIAILFPCILAGARDYTIGSDVLVYGNRIFYNSLSLSFTEYMKTDAEFLYLILVYVCSHICPELFFQYFIIEAIIFIPVYFILQRDECYRYAWLGVAVYFLVLFPYSLNLLRQSIAVSIVLFSLHFVLNHKFKWFVLSIFIAVLFHKTAIIALLIYPIFILIQGEDHNLIPNTKIRKMQRFATKHGTVISWLMIIISFFAVTQLDKLITAFYKFDNDSYSYFYDRLGGQVPLLNVLIQIFLLMPVFLIYFINNKYYSYKDNNIKVLFTLSAMGLVLYQARIISNEMYRISMYFFIFLPIFTEKTINLKSKQLRRWLSVFIVLTFAVIYFVYFFVICKWNKVYPYTSIILGIN